MREATRRDDSEEKSRDSRDEEKGKEGVRKGVTTKRSPHKNCGAVSKEKTVAERSCNGQVLLVSKYHSLD